MNFTLFIWFFFWIFCYSSEYFLEAAEFLTFLWFSYYFYLIFEIFPPFLLLSPFSRAFFGFLPWFLTFTSFSTTIAHFSSFLSNWFLPLSNWFLPFDLPLTNHDCNPSHSLAVPISTILIWPISDSFASFASVFLVQFTCFRMRSRHRQSNQVGLLSLSNSQTHKQSAISGKWMWLSPTIFRLYHAHVWLCILAFIRFRFVFTYNYCCWFKSPT